MKSQHAITATTMKQHIKQHNNYMHVATIITTWEGNMQNNMYSNNINDSLQNNGNSEDYKHYFKIESQL